MISSSDVFPQDRLEEIQDTSLLTPMQDKDFDNLSNRLNEANEKILLYQQGIAKLKKLIELENETITAHAYLIQDDSFGSFVSKFQQIVKVCLKEIIGLLELSPDNILEVKQNKTTPFQTERNETAVQTTDICQETDAELKFPTDVAASEVLVVATEPLELIPKKATNEKSCQHCGDRFSTKRDLRRHERIHTGEKPFPCELCGRSFARRDFLIKHTRIHTGDKPHICEYCGKRFSQRSNLTKHQLIHTKPGCFICDICPQAFTQASNLKRHRSKVHSSSKDQLIYHR